jgi:hypothetical protein
MGKSRVALAAGTQKDQLSVAFRASVSPHHGPIVLPGPHEAFGMPEEASHRAARQHAIARPGSNLATECSRRLAQGIRALLHGQARDLANGDGDMNGIVYLIGLVMIVVIVLSFLGLHWAPRSKYVLLADIIPGAPSQLARSCPVASCQFSVGCRRDGALGWPNAIVISKLAEDERGEQDPLEAKQDALESHADGPVDYLDMHKSPIGS